MAESLDTLVFEAVALQANGVRQPVGAGSCLYGVTDIEVERRTAPDGVVFWTKTLPLGYGGFGIGVYLDDEPLEGLGLFITNKLEPDSFSWEYLVPEGGDVFSNPRGPAQIKASIDRGAPSLQLRSLEFLTDFAVRYKDDPVQRQVGEFSHEFLVKKGSILRLVR